MFTQPIMYKNVAKKIPILDLYAKKLIDEGVVTEEWIQVCNHGNHLYALTSQYSQNSM